MLHNDAAVHAYYERDLEHDRLAEGLGRIEFARTCEIVTRALPSTPAVIADIGGGPGRYTDWLVELGHRVVHRDVVSIHVDHVRGRHGDRVDTSVGDARSLDLADNSVDAMLLLGPLYHLPDAADRAAVLAEAARVVRPGGTVWAAIITRWSAHLNGILTERIHLKFPAMLDMIDEVERTGQARPVFDGSFNGYFHTPDELRAEVDASPLELDHLVAVEGPVTAIPDLDVWWNDPVEREQLMAMLRRLESVPDLFDATPHLLAVARA